MLQTEFTETITDGSRKPLGHRVHRVIFADVSVLSEPLLRDLGVNVISSLSFQGIHGCSGLITRNPDFMVKLRGTPVFLLNFVQPQLIQHLVNGRVRVV